MKFKEMVLRDFRQFKDEVKITFSTDAYKNVTVVVGDNGAGKTTLLQAFNWCLYDQLSGLENPSSIINEDTLSKMNIGDTKEVSVSIVFEHNNKTYHCKNSRTYQKSSSDSSKEIKRKLVYTKTESDGQTYPIDEKEINDIFPKGLSKYFLFDGERLIQLGENKTKGKKDLANAVTNLLGLDVLRNTNVHLARAKSQFENEFVSDNTEELEKIKSDLELEEHNIESEKKKIESLDQENEVLEEEIKELDEKLKTFEKLKDLQEKRNEYNDRKSQVCADIEETRKQIFDKFSAAMPAFFLNATAKELRNKINNTKLGDKSIEGINCVAVDEILSRGRCICGCDLNYNKQARDLLIDLKNYILPNDYSASLKGLEVSIDNILEKNESFSDEFNTNYKKYNDLVNRQMQLDNMIADNDKKISEIGDEDVSRYNIEYQEKVKTYNENNSSIGYSRALIEKSKNEIQKLKSRRDDLAVGNGINKDLRRKVDICDDLIKEISKILEKSEKEIREKMQSIASKLLSEMLSSNKSIDIKDDYSFLVYDMFGNTVLSEGERIVVSFAFVSALISVAKENLIYKNEDPELSSKEDNVFTLVMDAPFAKLDISNSEGVSTVIPKLTDQIILFTVNKQWEGIIKECLIDRVGMMYEMKKDANVSGITSIVKLEE